MWKYIHFVEFVLKTKVRCFTKPSSSVQAEKYWVKIDSNMTTPKKMHLVGFVLKTRNILKCMPKGNPKLD